MTEKDKENTQHAYKVMEFLKSPEALNNCSSMDDSTKDYVRDREVYHRSALFMNSIRYTESLIDREPTDTIALNVMISDNDDRS